MNLSFPRVQAEIFREVFFGVDKLGGSACNAESLPVLSPQQCKEVFETATWRVLQRASTCGAVYLVISQLLFVSFLVIKGAHICLLTHFFAG